MSGTQQLLVAAGGGAQGVSRVGVRLLFVVLPMNAQACRCSDEHSLSTQGGVCKTCDSDQWQHGALRRVVLNAGKHGAIALSRDGDLRWLPARMYGLGIGGCAALWCQSIGWAWPY